VTQYVIAFNSDWVGNPTEAESRDAWTRVQALRAEMKQAGVLVFTGGVDDDAPVFSVDATSGTPVFSDGPYVETKERLGGLAIVDVPDDETARFWAGKVAVACGWPQEVRVIR
jgi:hypothetical protein